MNPLVFKLLVFFLPPQADGQLPGDTPDHPGQRHCLLKPDHPAPELALPDLTGAQEGICWSCASWTWQRLILLGLKQQQILISARRKH